MYIYGRIHNMYGYILKRGTRCGSQEGQTAVLVAIDRGVVHPEPSHLNSKPSTLDPHPSTLNSQPSTLNTQLSTLNPKPQTLRWAASRSRTRSARRLKGWSRISRTEWASRSTRLSHTKCLSRRFAKVNSRTNPTAYPLS